MTKAELIERMGNEDRANWVMEEILRNIKPDFIRMILKANCERQSEKIKEREATGYYMDRVNLPDDFNLWSYMKAVEDGEDDGSKAAAIEACQEQERRQLEKCSDRQTANFYGNMRAAFK